LVLMAAALAALLLDNSPLSWLYDVFLETPVGVRVGPLGLDKPLLLWINDGLMAVFFFLVGLEIKREALVGELASPRRAALPAAAALGGMVVPAALYALFNAGGEGAPGWGIPMATDIAFALGVLALLGPRVPVSLKVFLTALAIVDDIGAVLVIALFYTSGIAWGALFAGLGLLALAALANRLGARRPPVYVLLGVGVWACFLASGVHATVAGVLLAMTIPARTRIDADGFLAHTRGALVRFEDAGEEGRSVLTNHGQQAAIHVVEEVAEAAQAPLQRIEHELHTPVAFLVIPLFALANAGVALPADAGAALAHPVTLGIVVGLLLGKPVGITLFAWLAVRLGLAEMPAGLRWGQLHAVSWLGGIGFTMSLFVGGLAFADAAMVDRAKIGIFAASIAAGLIGWLLVRRSTAHPADGRAADVRESAALAVR
ncbi:MAG: Na+/H+ antiporter NhaA, partial [Longimicrobiaceae bacterium]